MRAAGGDAEGEIDALLQKDGIRRDGNLDYICAMFDEDYHVIGTGSVLRTAVIFFYISNEGVSLLENAGHLGLPIPAKVKTVLEQLHDRAEKEEN